MSRDLIVVLIVGSGARECALYKSILGSPLVYKVLCTPGNAGIAPDARRKIKESDLDGLVRLAKEENVGLVVIGPEAPLATGLVDRLEKEGIKAFGPSAAAARLEASKLFAKISCLELDIPTAEFKIASDYIQAERIIKKSGFRVIKADGLCAGKGAFVTKTEQEALEKAYDLLITGECGDAGKVIVIEERLFGDELSVMFLCDGVPENAIALPPVRDHKRLHAGENAPNTGGMGAYSPVPGVSDDMLAEIRDQIILPTLRGMAAEGTPFKGVLYAGIMLTPMGPKLLEFNVRFGDPEAQVLLSRLDSDIVPYLFAACEYGGLSGMLPLNVKRKVAVCTVLASGGYPEPYKTGLVITGIKEASSKATIFHAGTKHDERGVLVTSGGRVFSCIGVASTFERAGSASREAAALIDFEGKFFRHDIATNLPSFFD